MLEPRAPPGDKRIMNLSFFARTFGWCSVAILIVLSILPGSERPHTGAPGHVEHFLAYGGTGAFLAFGASTRALILRALALSALSGLLELAQLWVPGRTGEIGGFVYSTLGACLGLACGAFLWSALRAAGYLRPADRSKP